MVKLHPSVIATCVVTQQEQRRHSADISEREHRPQRLAKEQSVPSAADAPASARRVPIT
jgi:hypothetical protein